MNFAKDGQTVIRGHVFLEIELSQDRTTQKSDRRERYAKKLIPEWSFVETKKIRGNSKEKEFKIEKGLFEKEGEKLQFL